MKTMAWWFALHAGTIPIELASAPAGTSTASATLTAKADGEWRLLAPRGQKIVAVRSGKTALQIQPQADGSVGVELKEGGRFEVEFA